jgi:HPt (histidine-containing phosphotransfer) domain-containing protein
VEKDQQFALAGALDTLWAKFLPEMKERVATLRSAAEAFAEDELTDEALEQAHAAAHKLAGVLGTFGLTRGTVLARELEMMYSRENRPEPAQGAQLAQTAAELAAIVEHRK